MQGLPDLHVGIAQIAPELMDIEANVQKHIEYIRKAQEKGVELLVFPELSLTGVMLVPAAFSLVWFAILGGAGVYMQMNGTADMGNVDYSMVTYRLLEHLPWTGLTQTVTVFLVFIFLVTSADSGTYVLGMFSSRGNPNPPRSQCLFWGVIIALMVLGALLTGKGIAMLRALVAVGAIPFLFIMIWQGVCLMRSLKDENIPYREGGDT